MKKQILIIISLLLICSLNAESKEKIVTSYENSKDGIFIRKNEELVPCEDQTGNKLYFTENGKFLIYQSDSQLVYCFDKNDYKVIKEKKDYKLPMFSCLVNIENSVYVFRNQYNNCFAVNGKTGEKKFYIETNDISINGICYDEENDVLLFTDSNSNIHSIINPGLDDEQNKKNYRSPEQTKKLFSKDGEYGRKGLVIEGEILSINGNGYFWRNPNMNGKQYACYNDSFSIWEGRNKIYEENYEKYLNEQFESAAVHPSGDIYILRMNWNTNTHNLYRIKNTWDPEWRKQWYEKNK